MNKKTKQYRQGDVLIVPVKTGTPKGKDARENGLVILAHGEVTGHHHEVVSDEARGVSFEEIAHGADALAGAKILRVAGRSALLRHEEHAPIEIKRGTYRVIRQREYAPEGIRNVAD